MRSDLLPLRALKFLAIAAVTWALCLVWLQWFDPEINFSRMALANKQAWAKRLDHEFPSKTVVCGGSSVTFAINSSGLLEHHRLPVVNMGMHAGMGGEMLANLSLSVVQPGDTLVLALEPPHLTAPFSSSSLAAKLSWVTGNPQWLEQPWFAHPRPQGNRLALLRPGAKYVVTMSAKFLTGMPLYRYSKDDLHDGGWVTTSERRSFPTTNLDSPALSSDAKVFLSWLRDWCRRHQVRVAYLPPRSYTEPAQYKTARHLRLQLLEQISQWLPVLKDPGLGLSTIRENFADTANHLTEPAAIAYSDLFAGWIKNWETWDREELQAMITQPSITSLASSKDAPPPRSP